MAAVTPPYNHESYTTGIYSNSDDSGSKGFLDTHWLTVSVAGACFIFGIILGLAVCCWIACCRRRRLQKRQNLSAVKRSENGENNVYVTVASEEEGRGDTLTHAQTDVERGSEQDVNSNRYSQLEYQSEGSRLQGERSPHNDTCETKDGMEEATPMLPEHDSNQIQISDDAVTYTVEAQHEANPNVEGEVEPMLVRRTSTSSDVQSKPYNSYVIVDKTAVNKIESQEIAIAERLHLVGPSPSVVKEIEEGNISSHREEDVVDVTRRLVRKLSTLVDVAKDRRSSNYQQIDPSAKLERKTSVVDSDNNSIHLKLDEGGKQDAKPKDMNGGADDQRDGKSESEQPKWNTSITESGVEDYKLDSEVKPIPAAESKENMEVENKDLKPSPSSELSDNTTTNGNAEVQTGPTGVELSAEDGPKKPNRPPPPTRKPSRELSKSTSGENTLAKKKRPAPTPPRPTVPPRNKRSSDQKTL